MDSAIYSEIYILIDILFGNIFSNHLIDDIAEQRWGWPHRIDNSFFIFVNK